MNQNEQNTIYDFLGVNIGHPNFYYFNGSLFVVDEIEKIIIIVIKNFESSSEYNKSFFDRIFRILSMKNIDYEQYLKYWINQKLIEISDNFVFTKITEDVNFSINVKKILTVNTKLSLKGVYFLTGTCDSVIKKGIKIRK